MMCAASAPIIPCARFLRVNWRCSEWESRVDDGEGWGEGVSVTLGGREEMSQLCQAACLHAVQRDGPRLSPGLMTRLTSCLRWRVKAGNISWMSHTTPLFSRCSTKTFVLRFSSRTTTNLNYSFIITVPMLHSPNLNPGHNLWSIF